MGGADKLHHIANGAMNNYEVKQVIGSGSYGSVYEAWDHSKSRPVAIKKVKRMFHDLIDCKRILREISILSELRHKYVVQLYEVAIAGDVDTFDELCMVMEICDSDLKKLCRTDVTLTPLHINTLLYNLLSGLKYIHLAGIYHRDLKPANCLVNQDCSVKICDFGLSRVIGREDVAQLDPDPLTGQRGQPSPAKRSLTGHVVTRWYRAPELILLQENYTEAIDVWSVGCIYAELLGMLEGCRVEDRKPLFPGTSCFPLSPARKDAHKDRYSMDGKHDQLNMIFDIIGTPGQAEIKQLEREDARKYVECFKKRTGKGFGSLFPRAEAASLDMLQRMLRFAPEDRVTVAGALDHSLFNSIRPAKTRDPELALPAPQLHLDFEDELDLDEDMLRAYFAREVQRYRRCDGEDEQRCALEASRGGA
jgi:mitogen-activated protein kinase 1/3